MELNRIRILCFGDSNTWGYNPKNQSRYSEDLRWPSKLQSLLGGKFQIIEEGLNGRTTAFDYSERKGKNGRDYIIPCMDSHFPLDAVILCLGTNDTKLEFNRSAEEIADGLEEIIKIILGQFLEKPSPKVKLIVASPILINEKHIGDYKQFIDAEEKTRRLPSLYEKLAEKYSCVFVDLSKVAKASDLDGCHMNEHDHSNVAAHFYKQILLLF